MIMINLSERLDFKNDTYMVGALSKVHYIQFYSHLDKFLFRALGY